MGSQMPTSGDSTETARPQHDCQWRRDHPTSDVTTKRIRPITNKANKPLITKPMIEITSQATSRNSSKPHMPISIPSQNVSTGGTTTRATDQAMAIIHCV